MKLNDAELVVLVDLETTGLDHKTGLPLELAVLIVDYDLNMVAHFDSIIQWGVLDWEVATDDYVRNMHTQSGLIAAYDTGEGDPLSLVEAEAIAFLKDHDATRLPMCGSNVANFDRKWLAEFMPELNEGTFHYRNQDISSIKEVCRVWNPEVYAKLPPRDEKHRALADCFDSVEELRFYIQNFLFATRGPL